MNTLVIGEKPLATDDVYEVAARGRKVSLSARARKKIEASEAFLKQSIESGQAIYGVNTGFGPLSSVAIASEALTQLQYNLLRSHAAGVGDRLPDEHARAILLVRTVGLALGYSGVSAELVEKLVVILNSDLIPWIPEQGSVGASGDLIPLAHLALLLIGEGKCVLEGKVIPASEGLSRIGLKPHSLRPKEGLALINGTQFITGLGALAVTEAKALLRCANLAGAMSLEALRGSASPFDSRIHELRSHPGQVRVADELRRILAEKTEIAMSHERCGKMQDPYSLRCIPQVHGPISDAIEFTRNLINKEINSVTDNPIVCPESSRIYSGGNFHGEGPAMALDFLAIACAEIASISEQRISKIVNPSFSQLSDFLSGNPGLESGMMMVQVAAASLVSENKTLAHPASVDSIPTNGDKEDHVSMGAWAARKALKVIENARKVIAMEFLCAAQGIDLLRPLKSSPTIERVHAMIRKKVPKLDKDRALSDDLSEIVKMIADGRLGEVL